MTTEASPPRAGSIQRLSGGNSSPAIHAAALDAADPRPGLSWVDIGIGTGDVAREIVGRWSPSRLTGVDAIDWLEADLRPDVDLHVGDALTVLPTLEPADRVILVETLEHLDAPWSTLRLAAALVKPGGRLVISTPSVVTLRHRIELALRGRLTSFRPDAPQHMSPALPHITESVLRAEGLEEVRHVHAGGDIVPLSGGRRWPAWLAERSPALFHISVVTSAARPRGG